jgi:hypothetical protein
VTGTSGTPSTGTVGTSPTTTATSYQLNGITHPNEYSGKRVEVIGTVVNTRATNAMPMLRVTSVRVLGDTCP